MREELLAILEKNSRIDFSELAVLLGVEEPAVLEEIEKLEKEFSGNGRVLIRPSGTEPLIRVMIEGEDQNYIKEKAETLAKLIEKKLN